jgi:HEPN domain-containing protein
VTDGSGYRRDDLQKLAEAKLLDASLLADNERYSNAYYLAGYAVELGLKACIARQFRAETIPDPKLVQRLYTHRLTELIGLAGLTAALNEELAADRIFAANWSTATEWTENSRYEMIDVYSCRLMIEAVQDEKHGVLRWLKQHW